MLVAGPALLPYAMGINWSRWRRISWLLIRGEAPGAAWWLLIGERSWGHCPAQGNHLLKP